ncbi:hypothetical protein FJ366_00190 [Candidatus Dependentiae bacterium]|nr:hypothetical protein [Candidatus Dependentiae bacterium]
MKTNRLLVSFVFLFVGFLSAGDVFLAENRADVVALFTKLRSMFGSKVVSHFASLQKPHDLVACLDSISDQLSQEPRDINKIGWGEILRNLQQYVFGMEKLYVVDDYDVLFTGTSKEKPPQQAKLFLEWWKLNYQDSYVKFFGIYFDYNAITIQAMANFAWETVDADILYTDRDLIGSLAALNKCVRLFDGIDKFKQKYERQAKKKIEFINAMRKRLLLRKTEKAGELFTGIVASVPRVTDYYGICDLPEMANKSLGRFSESFLSLYGIGRDERSGHEYHEYLLDETAQSYTKLEQSVVDAGLDLHGRIMIMGYEGAAFESYFPNYKDLLGDSLCDETSLKGNAGWSKPPANYFGFLTGYAFRDANRVEGHEGRFEHVHENSVELYNRFLDLLQRDSFRQLYGFVQSHENYIRDCMMNDDVPGALEGVQEFLGHLYEKNLMINDGDTVASIATQDILFNQKQIQKLAKSPVSTLKFYTGADITYPIDLTKRHSEKATYNAQEFVKKFVKQLVPRDGDSTVYVFNSFVDGVGKTTLLGNIKNWMKYGPDMAKYEAADNSSSQLADIFEFSKDVFVADLPAQISHFTYKPDGYVFVDVASVKGLENKSKEVMKYFSEHKKDLVEAYQKRLQEVSVLISEKGWHAPELNDKKRPIDAFMKNLHLLKRVSLNTWIPCEYEGQPYLVDFSDSGEVRLFKPFKEGQSSGLKNIQADQMFFFDGITLPLEYQSFLDDLTSRCKEKGIKKVVFVDFLSMYPRTPRETVRVNYVMQQMALLYADFDQRDTVYREITDNCEMLALLYQRPWFDRLKENIKRETLVRWALNALLDEWKVQTLSYINFERSTKRISELFEELSADFKSLIDEAVEKKLLKASEEVELVYGENKDFVNVQQFSWDSVVSYAKELESVFTNLVTDRASRRLWGSFGGDVVESESVVVPGECDRVLLTTKLDKVRVRWVIDPQDRNKLTLVPIFRILRAVWYNACYQFITSTHLRDGKFKINQPTLLAPWSVRFGTNGFIYIVQPNISNYEGEVDKDIAEKDPAFAQFVNTETTQWAQINNRLLALDIDLYNEKRPLNTSFREYSFGNEERLSESVNAPQVSRFVTTKLISEFVQARGSADVLFLEKAERRIGELKTKSLLKKIDDLVRAGDKKRGKDQKEGRLGADEEKADSLDEMGNNELRSLDDHEYPGVKMFLKLITRMEQVVRDPEATLVVRKNNKNDIKVALMLLEEVVLPQYFGVVSQEKLYENFELNESCSGLK